MRNDKMYVAPKQGTPFHKLYRQLEKYINTWIFENRVSKKINSFYNLEI